VSHAPLGIEQTPGEWTLAQRLQPPRLIFGIQNDLLAFTSSRDCTFDHVMFVGATDIRLGNAVN
jgi:hypothetical protein